MDMPATRLGAPVSPMHGPEHVTGRTRVAADVDRPGMLWGKMRRRPHPHARSRRMDAAAAWRGPGVKAVVTGPDAPGQLMGQVLRDMPVRCGDRVRSIGDRVAAVAAETPDAAEDARWRIDVDSDVRPAVCDPMDAMRPEAPRRHDAVASYAGAPLHVLATDGHHGHTRLTWATGEVVEGCRQAAVMRAHACAVPRRHQGSLEPLTSGLSSDHDGRIQAWCSRQAPCRARVPLAHALGRWETHIRLAQRAQRPVTIGLRDGEARTASHPTHPPVVTRRSGVTRDGRLTAREVRTVHASGADGAMTPRSLLSPAHDGGGGSSVPHTSCAWLQGSTTPTPGGTCAPRGRTHPPVPARARPTGWPGTWGGTRRPSGG
jgi:CO/xanthine dehydrogenase Mo-binding subunit